MGRGNNKQSRKILGKVQRRVASCIYIEYHQFVFRGWQKHTLGRFRLSVRRMARIPDLQDNHASRP